jgi:hypothetical protein
LIDRPVAGSLVAASRQHGTDPDSTCGIPRASDAMRRQEVGIRCRTTREFLQIASAADFRRLKVRILPPQPTSELCRKVQISYLSDADGQKARVAARLFQEVWRSSVMRLVDD